MSTTVRLFTGLLALLPQTVLALNAVPDAECDGLIGCGGGAKNILASSLPQIASSMLNIASGLAVVMIVWSGFNMIIALGDESKTSQFKWGVINALLGLALAVSSSAIVTFIGTEYFGQTSAPGVFLADVMGAAVRIIVTLMNVSMLMVILLAGMRLVYSQGKSEEQSKAKTMITWAVAGAIVINISNALVHYVAYFFQL